MNLPWGLASEQFVLVSVLVADLLVCRYSGTIIVSRIQLVHAKLSPCLLSASVASTVARGSKHGDLPYQKKIR